MFDFSRGEFTICVEKLKQVLTQDPTYFDAQLALGMAYYRLGDFASAIAEGHKAEKLRPKEQLVHTNLSLFYMKSGDKVTAEHHGLQARIAGWRAENAAAQANAELDAYVALYQQRYANPQCAEITYGGHVGGSPDGVIAQARWDIHPTIGVTTSVFENFEGDTSAVPLKERRRRLDLERLVEAA